MTSRHLEGHGPAPEDGDAGRLRYEIETRRQHAVKLQEIRREEGSHE